MWNLCLLKCTFLITLRPWRPHTCPQVLYPFPLQGILFQTRCDCLFGEEKTLDRSLYRNKISQTTAQIHFVLSAFSLQCNFERTNICVKGQTFGPISQPSNWWLCSLSKMLPSHFGPMILTWIFCTLYKPNASILLYISPILSEHSRILEFQEVQTWERGRRKETEKKEMNVYSALWRKNCNKFMKYIYYSIK